MHMPMKSLAVAAIVVLGAITSADGKKPAIRVPGTYTNLHYNEEGGDLLGMEIKIVPVQTRFQAVVLVSEGEPQPLVVVDVHVSGSSVKFDVPAKEGNSWTFSGIITAKSLTGTISHASGEREKVVLPRRCGYWDR